MAVMTASLMMTGTVTAFANGDPAAEEVPPSDTSAEAPAEQPAEAPAPAPAPPVETPAPETNPAPTGTAFTTPGNSVLGDQVVSAQDKDFYTIHTKNNNTYYLVIDHSGGGENVYLLSMIDEDDLQEFLSKSASAVNPDPAASVAIPDGEESEKTDKADPLEKETRQPAASQSPLMLIGLLAAGAVAGALYYFKVYRPGKDEDDWESENMELEDGLPTEREEEPKTPQHGENEEYEEDEEA